MSQKPSSELWVIDLTSEVIGWPVSLITGYQSLRLVTADVLFSRSSSSIRGETARGILPPVLRHVENRYVWLGFSFKVMFHFCYIYYINPCNAVLCLELLQYCASKGSPAVAFCRDSVGISVCALTGPIARRWTAIRWAWGSRGEWGTFCHFFQNWLWRTHFQQLVFHTFLVYSLQQEL